jgi:hypothetical protein
MFSYAEFYSEFSDCDEEQLVHQLEKVEREIKKPKLDFICDICGKSCQQIRNKIQHMKTYCTVLSQLCLLFSGGDFL